MIKSTRRQFLATGALASASVAATRASASAASPVAPAFSIKNQHIKQTIMGCCFNPMKTPDLAAHCINDVITSGGSQINGLSRWGDYAAMRIDPTDDCTFWFTSEYLTATGSFNWSPSAAHQNDEVLMVIHSPLLAAHFTREMDRLWRGAELGINDRLARKLAMGRQRCGSGVQRS